MLRLPGRFSITTGVAALVVGAALLLIAPFCLLWTYLGRPYLEKLRSADDEYWRKVYTIRVAKHVMSAWQHYVIGATYQTKAWIYGDFQSQEKTLLVEVCLLELSGALLYKSAIQDSDCERAQRIELIAPPSGITEEVLRGAPSWFRGYKPSANGKSISGRRLISIGFDAMTFGSFFGTDPATGKAIDVVEAKAEVEAVGMRRVRLSGDGGAEGNARELLQMLRALSEQPEPRRSRLMRLRRPAGSPPDVPLFDTRQPASAE